jgi:NAD-dependent deacetylase
MSNSKKKIIVFSGAGISAESGIQTFRDSGGLWENYKIEDVATPEAWKKNPALVLDFYNQRRKQIMAAQPNNAHYYFTLLEDNYDVQIITQNIDDLHERAGSSKVLHLHGEIMKARSTYNESLVYNLDHGEIKLGDKCEKGSQLRPHIVWFNEAVPNMDVAVELLEDTDFFIIIGTSLNVYPAAGILNFVPQQAKKILIDPKEFNLQPSNNITHIKKTAVLGVNDLSNYFDIN